MRKLIILVILTVLSVAGFSQTLKSSQVPRLTKGKFMFQFPQTQDTVQFPVTWEKDGANYKASFLLNEATAYVILDSLGNTKKLVRRISLHKLPEQITKSLKQKYANVEPKYIVLIVDENGKESYQITMEIMEFYTPEGTKTTGKKENVETKKAGTPKK
jgi:hypothetical protein